MFIYLSAIVNNVYSADEQRKVQHNLRALTLWREPTAGDIGIR